MKFFSIQIDGNTDSANIEEEVFLVMYLDPHAKAGKIHVCDKYLAIWRPSRSNAEGLFECFERALAHAGIADSDWESKLIGFGCDGTNVNQAANGLQGYLEQSVPGWCHFGVAHRLEHPHWRMLLQAQAYMLP